MEQCPLFDHEEEQKNNIGKRHLPLNSKTQREEQNGSLHNINKKKVCINSQGTLKW